MKLKISAGSVPAGSYSAKFVGVEPFQSKDGKYGDGLRWKFQIVGGSLNGQVASRITGPTPSPKNSCGQVLSGMLGKSLQADQEFDIDLLVGRTFLIVVKATANGTRIETVVELPKVEAAPSSVGTEHNPTSVSA